MTIKELNAVVLPTQEISIGDSFGNRIDLNREDSVVLSAFGDFEIQNLIFFENSVEVRLKLIPVKSHT